MAGKTLPFRLYAQILIFSALVALGAVILMPLQQAAYSGMINIRDDLISLLERQIGRRIRYSSISPSLFGSFDVRNVRIIDDEENPVLTMSRFRVTYSLFDLIRGRTQSIRSVQVDAPLIDFHISRDSDLLDLFENISGGQESPPQRLAEILPEKLLFRIRNGRCLITGTSEKIEFDTVNLNAEIAGNRIIVDSRWSTGMTFDRLIGEPVHIIVPMKVNGSVGTNLDDGDVVVSIQSVSGDAHSSTPLDFGIVIQNGSVNIRKMPDAIPLNISLAYAIEAGSVVADMDCHDIRLRDYFSFSGGLENAGQLLDVAGSGAASFTRSHDGKLGYAVDLAGAAQTMQTSFEISAAGDGESVQVNTVRFFVPRLDDTDAFFYGAVGFSGRVGLRPFAPHGTLFLGDFSLSGLAGINAEISVGNHAGEIFLFCETLSIGHGDSAMELAALSAEFQPDENDLGFSVSALRFTNIESWDDVHLGIISVEGAVNSESRSAEASLRLDSFSASDLFDMTLPFVKSPSLTPPAAAVLKSASVTTEVFFSTDFTNLLYNAPRFVFASGANRPFIGLVSISGTNRRLELSEGSFIMGDDALLVSGDADFSSPGNINFSVNAHYRDLGYLIRGAILDGKLVNIQGSYGLNVNIASAGGSGYSGTIRADNFPVPFIGQPALLSVAARLRYDSPALWSVVLEQFQAVNLASPIGLAQLRVSGSADQHGIVVPTLYYSDRLGSLGGNAEISWTPDYSAFNGTAAIRQDRENYRVQGSYTNSRLNLRIGGSSMRLDRLIGKISNTYADGEIRLVWESIESFRAEFDLTSVSGRLFEQEFSAKARAVLDAHEFSVNGLNVSFADMNMDVPKFVINGSGGFAEAVVRLNGIAGGKLVNGNIGLSGIFVPVQSWFQIGGIVQSLSGTARFNEFRYGSMRDHQSFAFHFSRSGGNLSVSGGPREMLRFQLDNEGNFYAGLSNPFPVRGTVAGSIKDKTINARCGDLYVDMAGLFAILPESPEIYLTGGFVNASVDIRGSINDPEFFGTARGTSLRFRIPGFIPVDLRPIPFNVRIDGNEMYFGPVSTVVGNGAGTVGGWFRFDRWIPDIFSLDIAVPRETPIPYEYDKSGFIARGDASGNLSISMENRTMEITGDLLASNTEMGVNSEEIAMSHEKELFSGMKIAVIADLSITSGTAVEFLYPSSRFPILRATPDMGTKLRVTADSLAKQYSLTSDVRIRGGEIFYFERSFYIRSGTLTFRENERRFSPLLTARAEVRDRTEEGPVTISMIVDNAPLLSFTARFESSPPLSQMEILALMGQSITGTQFNENTGAYQRAFLSSTADLLAQFVVVRQLEQQIRNFLQLDMFSVRTQVLQNFIFTRMGYMQQPVDRTGEVGNYFDNTTVFGGKYIGQDMFVQGMLSMSYDANKTTFGGLTVRPDIGLELQNPWFSIRWDFIPTHPENWFVNDNSITVTKSWSF